MLRSFSSKLKSCHDFKHPLIITNLLQFRKRDFAVFWRREHGKTGTFASPQGIGKGRMSPSPGASCPKNALLSLREMNFSDVRKNLQPCFAWRFLLKWSAAVK